MLMVTALSTGHFEARVPTGFLLCCAEMGRRHPLTE